MSTNHVQPDSSSTAQAGHNQIFGNTGHEAYSFNNLYANPHNFAANLNHDPRNHALAGTPSHSPYNSSSAFNPPAWQGSPVPPAQSQPYGTSRSYYDLSTTTTASGFNANAYSQNVDPNLFRPSDSRNYGQPLPTTSSQAQTSTIAPSALYQAGQAPRPANSPSHSMQAVFSSANLQPVTQYSREPSHGSIPNGRFVTQLPKAPAGTQNGIFNIIPPEDLAKITPAKRLSLFASVSAEPVELNLTRVNIPQYIARKSHNELKALAANDPALRAKISKRVKKTKVHAVKPIRPLQTAPSKGSPVELSSESESSDDDSDSSYDSDSSPPPEKSPLPAVRPQKAVEAVRYDTMKAVWLPRNKFAENERILKGLSDLWEVVRTIRDRWKSDRDAVKKAIETKQTGELPLLKERVEKQVEMMEAVLTAAIDFGHGDLLSACGQHATLMLACYQFILEPVREGNYKGPLIKAVFKFLSMCSSLNGEIADKSGLSKLFSRSVKRGNDEIKALTAKINDNIAKSNSKTKPTKAPEAKQAIANGSPKPVKTETELTSGVKRPRPGDNTSLQPAKRVASGVGTTANNAPAKDSVASKLGLVKKATPVSSATPPTVAKAKIVRAPAPTTNFFSGLQSASKKPGTSIATQGVKKPLVAEQKTPAPAAASAPARPAFSFAETMANLNKEKIQEPPKKKDEPKRPPETEDEKAKRIRKEARSKLRVRWKPDSALVEIRTFTSEISGQTRSVRDGDGKEKEGITLKKHMDQMDVDEDDDDQPTEQSYFEFNDPTLVDFSVIETDERNRNYERYGGHLKVDSAEKTVQDNREATTLMASYLVKSDIPPNPREPADPYTGTHVETKMIGYPDERSPWLIERLNRISSSVPVALPSNSEITALLQNFQSGNLAQILPASNASTHSYKQPSAVNPQPVDSYWTQGGQQPAQANSEPNQDIASILAALTGAAPAPQAPSAPPMQYQQPPQAPAPAGVSEGPVQPNADVQQILAQIHNVQAFQYANYNYTGAAAPAQDQHPQGYYGSGSNATPVYGNDTNGNDQQSNNAGKRKWQGNNNKKFMLPCRYWKDGKCKKGDQCTFRHDS